MAVRKILLLGNPVLYEICRPVQNKELQAVHEIVNDLHDTLLDFRKQHGVGRAIAAPQIGVVKRIIYMCINNVSTVFINPEIYDQSKETMEIWDDCMSFPDLLVRVRRHKSCRIRFHDLKWEQNELLLEGDFSELLQHEYDHLNGILSVSRAIDGRSFALRKELVQ